MRKRIDIGTDIATIGVWDPTFECPDLSAANYADYQAGLEAEASAGRLFFILTHADGSYPAVIYAGESPAPDTLVLYKSAARSFLVHCSSGRMIAGGIEDFVNKKNVITSAEDEFSLTPGSYTIQFYELIEEKLIARLRVELGDSDYDYYADRAERLPWGCALVATILFTVILLFTQFWGAALAVFCTGFVYAIFRRRTQAGDHRFHSIAERVRSIDADIPPFIYVLQPVDKSSNASGGWHSLE